MATKIPQSGEHAYTRQLMQKHKIEFTKFLYNNPRVNGEQTRIILAYYTKCLKSLNKEYPNCILNLYTHAMPIFFSYLLKHDLESLLKFSTITNL